MLFLWRKYDFDDIENIPKPLFELHDSNKYHSFENNPVILVEKIFDFHNFQINIKLCFPNANHIVLNHF